MLLVFLLYLGLNTDFNNKISKECFFYREKIRLCLSSLQLRYCEILINLRLQNQSNFLRKLKPHFCCVKFAKLPSSYLSYSYFTIQASQVSLFLWATCFLCIYFVRACLSEYDPFMILINVPQVHKH